MLPSNPKRTILLVAFGTSEPRGRNAYHFIEERVRKAFPSGDIRWAFTSRTIRRKLWREGKTADSPETALARMMDEGIDEVAILSLHVIPGEEFHHLTRNAHLFSEMSGGFRRVGIARPLLSSQEDLARVARGLLNTIPGERRPEDAVIFMGHGSKKHPANALYAAMNYLLQNVAPAVHVATVDGYPSLHDVLPRLSTKGSRKVYLMPFMVVAGVHAVSDMAGDGPDSWKSILQREGYTCEVSLTGIAEFPEIVEVWVDHLREVLGAMGQ
jgi:sirohydrochlorin cobaltochelatase